MALDLSSLFSPPTGQPQQGMPQGLLSLFGGGGGSAGNPATQQMQQGMGMLNAGQPYQLPSPPMQRPMIGGGGGMRQMGMQQPGMVPAGAALGNATGNPFLAALLQRLQSAQHPSQMAGDVVPLRPGTILPGLVGPEGRTIDLGGGAGMQVSPPTISPGQYPFMPQTEPSLRWLLRNGAANEASLSPQQQGMSPSPLSFNLMGSGY